MELVLPPVYHVRVFEPQDARAEETLAAMRRLGPPTVAFDAMIHWSSEL
jgi:hypothetical protein